MAGGKCKVAWPIVCSPKDIGRLGLLDLRLLGFALRLRWEWLRQTQPDTAWALLPPNTEHTIDAMFKASVTFLVGDGAKIRFWTDAWLLDGAICSFAPSLFRAIGPRRRHRSVRDALHDRQWTKDITRALTAAVLVEYIHLWEVVDGYLLAPGTPDQLVWKWTADGEYSSSSAYRAFFNGSTSMLGAREVWQASVPPKVKFFLWIALHGRVWTAERCRRHGLQQNTDCALCDQADESSDHLFCSCVFTREVWHRVLTLLGIPHLCPVGDRPLDVWWMEARGALSGALRRSFDSVVLLVSWIIWKERNRRTFDSLSKSTTEVLAQIQDEGSEWIAAGCSALGQLLAVVI